MPRKIRPAGMEGAFLETLDGQADAERVQAFRSRQDADLARLGIAHGLSRRRNSRWDGGNVAHDSGDDCEPDSKTPLSGSWRNAEGDRLEDYGVDEDVDLEHEDDVPLGRLLEKKRNTTSS